MLFGARVGCFRHNVVRGVQHKDQKHRCHDQKNLLVSSVAVVVFHGAKFGRQLGEIQPLAFFYRMVSGQTIKVHDLSFSPFISREEIAQKVKELAARLDADFEGKTPLFLPILNGAFMFAADLFKEIRIPCEVSFVKVASYHGTESSGSVKEVLGLQTDIKGRHIVLVEDIVDTGLTMSQLLKRFHEMEPASISIAALFLKPTSLKVPIEIQYLGFEIENRFILGYGLDYKGQGRNLPDVYQLAT